jgi:hypothetical protein
VVWLAKARFGFGSVGEAGRRKGTQGRRIERCGGFFCVPLYEYGQLDVNNMT